MKEYWQLSPLVKKTVTALAWSGVGLSCITALGALLELLCTLTNNPTAAYYMGAPAEISLQLLCATCGLLLPWCHDVLLAGRGLPETRVLSWFGALGSLLLIASLCISLLTGQLIHPLQVELISIPGAVLLVVITTNLPNMAAMHIRGRVRLALLPLAILAAYITNDPSLIFFNDLAKILVGLIAGLALLRIAQSAPYIAGMPSRYH